MHLVFKGAFHQGAKIDYLPWQPLRCLRFPMEIWRGGMGTRIGKLRLTSMGLGVINKEWEWDWNLNNREELGLMPSPLTHPTSTLFTKKRTQLYSNNPRVRTRTFFEFWQNTFLFVFWGSSWQFRLNRFLIRFLLSMKGLYEFITRKINKLGFQTIWSLNIRYLFTNVLCIFL